MDSVQTAALRRAADALRIASQPTPRHEPRPNLARLFVTAAEGRKLDGADREALEESARQAGQPFDSFRWVLPWRWLSRDLSTAASGGGYLVETDVPAAFDVLRPFSTVARAGVQILDGLAGNVVLPVTSAIGAPTWHTAETTAPAGATPTVGSLAMTPKTVSNTVPFSRLLTLMAPKLAEPYVRRELTRSLAGAVDAAVLVGSGGSGEPLGLVNTPSIATATGTSFAQATATEMLSDVAEADALEDRVAFVGHPLVRKLLQARARATGLGFIWDDDKLVSRPAHVSTALADDALLAADWSRVVLGLWGPGLELEVTPFASGADFQAGIIRARAILSCDVALLTPGAVCLAASVT